MVHGELSPGGCDASACQGATPEGEPDNRVSNPPGSSTTIVRFVIPMSSGIRLSRLMVKVSATFGLSNSGLAVEIPNFALKCAPTAAPVRFNAGRFPTVSVALFGPEASGE